MDRLTGFFGFGNLTEKWIELKFSELIFPFFGQFCWFLSQVLQHLWQIYKNGSKLGGKWEKIFLHNLRSGFSNEYFWFKKWPFLSNVIFKKFAVFDDFSNWRVLQNSGEMKKPLQFFPIILKKWPLLEPKIFIVQCGASQNWNRLSHFLKVPRLPLLIPNLRTW